MRRSVAFLAVLVLVLGACGGDDDAGGAAGDGAPAKGDGGPGDYVWESDDGGTVTFHIPAPAGDPVIAKVEAFRAAVPAAQVLYVTVDIDNTGGDEELNLPELSVVTPGGSTLSFVPVWHVVGDWQDRIDINDETDLYDRGVDLYNSQLNLDSVLPGARSHVVLVVDPPGALDVGRVFVQTIKGNVELKRA